MIVITAIVLLMQAYTYTANPTMVAFMEYRYDKIQHFGAGAACGIFGCYLYAYALDLSNRTHCNREVMLSAIITALVIGVLWEIFEHTFPEVNGGTHSYLTLDTNLDICFDVLGGFIAGMFYRVNRK